MTIRTKTRNLRRTKTKSMKKLLIILIFFYSIVSIKAQKFSDAIPETREIVLNAVDTIKKIRIFVSNPKVKIEENKFYAWYQKQIILHTQGAWSGKLLQGKYESFYPNHNLLEQGTYEKGWKVGIWKKWYADGTLKEQVIWKKGLRHGSFEIFDTNGQLMESGQYRNGQLHGFFSTITNGKEHKVKYRKGELVVKKPKPSPFKFLKSKKKTSTTTKELNKKEKRAPKETIKRTKKTKIKKDKKARSTPKKQKEK